MILQTWQSYEIMRPANGVNTRVFLFEAQQWPIADGLQW